MFIIIYVEQYNVYLNQLYINIEIIVIIVLIHLIGFKISSIKIVRKGFKYIDYINHSYFFLVTMYKPTVWRL